MEVECWEINKIKDADSVPTFSDRKGIRLVNDYIGNFNEELPSNYFDIIFSSSTLGYEAIGDTKRFKDILKDINRD